MKVVFIAHEDMINGASKSMINLMDTLHKKCKFIVVSPYKTGPFVEEVRKRKIKLYYVPFKRWVENNADKIEFAKRRMIYRKQEKETIRLAEEFSEIIKKEQVDLVHSNTTVVDFGYHLSKFLNVPHIWHAREFGEADFSMYPLCSYKKYYQKISDNNYVVCVSKSVQKKFKNKVEDSKLRVIYNGVDKPKEIKNYDKRNKKLVLLQTGMIAQGKGQVYTIQAVNELYEEGYKDIELHLAGRGNVEDLGVSINKKCIKVLGQVKNMTKERKNVDIEIVASRREAFGRVTVEAMMMGIPVIGSNSGGTKELIENNKTGLLFERSNYKDLKEKIKYLYKNRSKIKELGLNAYNYSKDYFLIERCANEIYKLYEEVTKED